VSCVKISKLVPQSSINRSFPSHKRKRKGKRKMKLCKEALKLPSILSFDARS
jgi:hypothetical protein